MDRLPTTVVTVIPHSSQQYDTAGDYVEVNDCWHVYISKLEKWQYEALVFLHEFVEMCLTKNNGVDWKDIDYFDKEGAGKGHPDPGTLRKAPYHKEHMQALKIEKLFAKMLGVDWNTYDSSFEKLEYKL